MITNEDLNLRKDIIRMKRRRLVDIIQELAPDINIRLPLPILRILILKRIQECTLGALSKEEISQWKKISETPIDSRLPATVRRKHAAKVAKKLKVLSREYKGRVYEVVVLPNGKYSWQGHSYRSLSAIAESITGRRTNGNLFFNQKVR